MVLPGQALDVVIVGGGVGGSALAASLAQAGLAVVVLERETTFVDRVRGEWIAPWGVAEAKRLGLYGSLIAAGGHHLARMIGYDELLTPAQAEEATLVLTALVPDVPGPLCMQHVAIQNALIDLAATHGARIRRGVGEVAVTAGATPTVRYSHEGSEHRLSCRLVVGADGRSSSVRRQLGLALRENPMDHLISGLLVAGAEAWPDDVQAVGKIGDVMCLVFPQGQGRVRLYVDYDLTQRGRYSGETGAAALLRAFDHPCLPAGNALAAATAIGPCRAFPSQDAVLDQPAIDGAVLIGDAAGYTDPIWGQGLSMSLRDARLVRDLLLSQSAWSAATFAPYVAERRERMRRVMLETRFATTMYARFDPAALEIRARAMARLATRPELGGYLAAAFCGPEGVPAEVFTEDYQRAIFGP